MRDMLENAAADRPEKPGLWVFNKCVNFLRTVPTLQRDDNQPTTSTLIRKITQPARADMP
jgi:hypothetical protein